MKLRNNIESNLQNKKYGNKSKVSTIYNSSLEQAFKTPLLCDVSKVHTGYGIMPKVTHCTEDENWGKVGSTKKFMLQSL